MRGSSTAPALMIGAVIGLCTLGCSSGDGTGADPGTDGPRIGHAPNGDYLLPADTLTDWVSYMEQLSAVTVLSEEEGPPSESVLQNREGPIGRRVRLRHDEAIWVNKGVTPLKDEFQVSGFGWYLKGDKKQTWGSAYSPRLEVGGRYVMALTRFDQGWAALTPESTFPVNGDAIATEDIRTHGYSPVAHQLDGKTSADLAQILEATPRNPIAEKHWDLPPVARYQAVARETTQGP